MSISVGAITIRCDFPLCRATLLITNVTGKKKARKEASSIGWETRRTSTGKIHDICPTCINRLKNYAEEVVTQRESSPEEECFPVNPTNLMDWVFAGIADDVEARFKFASKKASNRKD